MEAIPETYLQARVRERLKAVGSNPFAAAKAAGLGNDFVRDILRGKIRSPGAAPLRKLAVALDCDVDFLLGNTPNSNQQRGRRLQKARIAAGFKTAASLARRLGIGEPTLRAHEDGRNGYSTEQAQMYAAVLGIDAAWLLLGASPDEDLISTRIGLANAMIRKLREPIADIAEGRQPKDNVMLLLLMIDGYLGSSAADR